MQNRKREGSSCSLTVSPFYEDLLLTLYYSYSNCSDSQTVLLAESPSAPMMPSVRIKAALCVCVGLFSRGHLRVFEAWFLLIQCAHWVQVAIQLLATSQPEDCGPPLWLLTFYHHPTNRGHHRASQLVKFQKQYG